MPKLTSPTDILFNSQATASFLSPCDHYAGNIKFALKALQIQLESKLNFDITCDLEDGASTLNPTQLRKDFVELIGSSENKKLNMGVRINPLSSKAWQADLKAIILGAAHKVSHITLPKITSVQQVKTFLQQLGALERKAKIKSNRIRVHVLIETLPALAAIDAIAKLKRVDCLEFGLMDFISEHQGRIPSFYMQSPWQFEHPLIIRAKNMLVATAAQHSKGAAHNVTVDYSSAQQAYLDAKRAKQNFGFTRMWSIHPQQILPILQAFTPSKIELQVASDIIKQAQAANWGPIQVNGQLHDRASYRYFWNLLQQAKNLGVATLP